MADSYYLKLMGHPELLDPFGRRVRFRVRKYLALLIYLVLDQKTSCRRETLIELLWPRSQGKGGQSLSMACSVLRAVFGPDSIRGKRDIAQFMLPAITTDLGRLERRDLLGTEFDPPLEVDILLRDFDIGDAPEFQHWVDRKRSKFLPEVKAGVATFIDQARRSGDAGAMKTFADRLLDLDPLSEEGIAARMEAFTLQGDRLGALRLYETWKRDLLDQLRAAPSKELEAMAGRLRKRSQALAASPAAAIVEQHGERPFIGRAAEYRVLFEAWEATCDFRSTHVLLTGESGIGKSTLAIRFGSAAALAGAAVARVQCFELEQRIAFGMIGALVTELLDRPGIAATAPESLAEVARIVPKVRGRFPNLPDPRNTEGEAARLRFAEGAFAMFDALMEEHPLVLIVDDYPRSDEASLSVLHLLLRRSENRRLMVVLTARPPEPGEPPQAGRIRQAISYVPARRVDLAALTEPECEALLQATIPESGKLAAPERRAILRTAAGNPMALELLIRDSLAHPDAPLAVLLTAMRSEVTGAALRAEDYDQLIERILPSLGARHRVALFLAVILGPRLNDFRYFQSLDFSPAQIMAALSELVECRILRSTERGLEFVNEVMRARLYLNIPVMTRVRLHDSVATMLLEAMGRGELVSRLEIAWHCIRAKRKDEAAPHLITGARQSLSKGAPDEVARALGSALRELKGQTWQEAAVLLAEAYYEMGEPKAILGIVSELRDTHPSDPTIRELAEELEIDARRALGYLSVDEGTQLIKQFVAAWRNRNTQIGKARAALVTVRIAVTLSDIDLFDELQVALARMPTESFEPRQKAITLVAQAMTAFHRRDTNVATEAATKACELLEQTGCQDSTLASLNIGLGVVATAQGDYLKALEPFEKAMDIGRRLENEGIMVMAAQNLALANFRLGNYEAQREWALRARRIKGEGIIPFLRVTTVGLLGMASVNLGLNHEAEETLGVIRNEIGSCEAKSVGQFGLYFIADILWLLGRKVEAFDAAIEAGAGQDVPTTPALTGAYARWSSLISCRNRTGNQHIETLLHLRQKRERLDALDRAELDGAVIYMCKELGVDTTPFESDFRSALADLPPACTRQLEALGLVVNNSRANSLPKAPLRTQS